MSLSRETQRAIMAADQARRDARDIAEFLAIMGTPAKPKDHAMLVRADARAIGAVTALGAPQRVKPRTAATECFADSDGNVVYVPGAVKVTHGEKFGKEFIGGCTEYAPASRFHKVRESKRTTRKNRPIVIPEVMRLTRSASDIAHTQALADGTA